MLALAMTQKTNQVPVDGRLWRTFTTPVGVVLVVVSDAGVQRIDFVDHNHEEASASNNASGAHPILADALLQLTEYFEGTRTTFSLPLDIDGTEFQQLAWFALARIPYGRTMTYGEQAANIGRPRAVRAIGTANSKNPIAIVLPCHRVIGADGSLTGYAGGLDKKIWLLDHERSR